MYDKVVSLGYNCEVSFRIEDYFGAIDAMPFSWSFTLNRDKFADAMRAPENLLSEGITVRDDHMLMCNRYELKFHPRYSIFPQFGEYTEEQLQEATAELKERVKHLAEKFNNLCKSDLKTLFVMKVEDKGTGHQSIAACLYQIVGISVADSPIDFDDEIKIMFLFVFVDLLDATQGFRHEGLTAEARFHRHH